MLKRRIFLMSLIVMNLFSLCSCGENVTKNTISYTKLYNKDLKTVKIQIPEGFNMEELYIPSYVDVYGEQYKVTNLYVSSKDDDFFLKDNNIIKKVVIENEFITTFGYDTFRNTSLEYLDISKATALTQIGDHAFAYSSNLKEVKMAPNVEKLYKGVFISTSVKEVIFPNSLVEIGINTFFNTQNLETVDFGSSLKVIQGSTFEKSSIKYVYGESIDYVDNYAFKITPNLEYIDLSNVKYIGKEAFYQSGIKEVTLTDCVIKPDAFRESSLESISITNCDNIEYKAFGDCKNLKNVSLNGNIYKIGSNAFKGTKIKEISIPNTCTFIGSEAFKDCSSLNKVTLPSSLESISSDAFRNCSSLSEIEFPSSLKRIYSGAFIDTGLTRVSLSRNVEVMENAFPKNCEINYCD